MLRNALILILLIFTSKEASPKAPALLTGNGPAWALEALRMTGESDAVRERALQRLRKMPGLENLLRQELSGARAGLALDVISALEIRSLLPDLLKSAREDQAGFIYLTLNNLMTSKNRRDLVRFYKKQVLCKFLCQISDPGKVVILETLARLNEELAAEDLQDLYSDSKWPEVQVAILDYVRAAVLKHKKENYASLLKLGLNSEVRQLREQAQAIFNELPQPLRSRWLPQEAPPLAPLLRLDIPHTVPPQVRVAFGYKDARPARFVGDRYERLFLIQSLMASCGSKSDLACEFERDKSDLNFLMKRIKTSTGEPQVIRLQITASAAGPDDDDNRNNPYQSKLSAMSRRNFLEGLRSAEAVFYVGHSRDGGGPDFSPPRLLKNKHVDYVWYRKNQPGLRILLKNLRIHKKIKRSPFKLGLLSCASTQHFEKRIQSATEKAQMVTVPKLIYYADALQMLRTELSQYLHLKINGSVLKN